MDQPALDGVHHVALNVRDLERSVRWYQDVLGFEPLFPYNTDDFSRQLLRHPSGFLVGLTTHNHPDAMSAFSEQRTGLDHLSFAVGTREELDEWAAWFDAVGVTHSGAKVTPVTGSALIAFRDPDDIQLELYVAQGASTP